MAKKADLDRCWSLRGRPYGPGEDVEIPDELYDILVDKGYIESDGSAQQPEDELFEGLTDEQVANLEAAGFDSKQAIAAASEEELVQVDEVGPATAKKLKQRAG